MVDRCDRKPLLDSIRRCVVGIRRAAHGVRHRISNAEALHRVRDDAFPATVHKDVGAIDPRALKGDVGLVRSGAGDVAVRFRDPDARRTGVDDGDDPIRIRRRAGAGDRRLAHGRERSVAPEEQGRRPAMIEEVRSIQVVADTDERAAVAGHRPRWEERHPGFVRIRGLATQLVADVDMLQRSARSNVRERERGLRPGAATFGESSTDRDERCDGERHAKQFSQGGGAMSVGRQQAHSARPFFATIPSPDPAVRIGRSPLV